MENVHSDNIDLYNIDQTVHPDPYQLFSPPLQWAEEDSTQWQLPRQHGYSMQLQPHTNSSEDEELMSNEVVEKRLLFWRQWRWARAQISRRPGVSPSTRWTCLATTRSLPNSSRSVWACLAVCSCADTDKMDVCTPSRRVCGLWLAPATSECFIKKSS